MRRRSVTAGIAGPEIGGVLGSSVGLRETIWIGAFGGSLCFITLLASPFRHVRTVDDAEQLVAAESA